MSAPEGYAAVRFEMPPPTSVLLRSAARSLVAWHVEAVAARLSSDTPKGAPR